MEAFHQWASRPEDQRFQTLDELHAAVKGRAMNSREHDLDSTELKATMQDGQLAINGTVEPSTPTHWSFGQLCAGIKAPANYLRTLPPDLALANIQNGIGSNQTRDKWKLLTVQRDTGLNTLQAITSQRYGRIYDFQCVEAVQRIVDVSGGKFRNPVAFANAGQFGGKTQPSGLYASDHDVFMFLIDGGDLLDAGERAQLHRGFIVSNSETGAGTFTLQMFMFNHVCGNNMIWGMQDFQKLSIRHTSGGPTRFDNEAAKTLAAYAESHTGQVIGEVKAAQEFRLPEPKLNQDGSRQTLLQTLAGWKPCEVFSKKELEMSVSYAQSEEQKCETLWDLVQGATAYARGFAWIDAKLELEKKAGSLMKQVAGRGSAPVTISV
jgi:hypothetical protein